MSLSELGRNDVSEETQALRDRLASRDTENAGLRTQLMRREAELEELQATLNETVYKLSKEAERVLQFEEDASVRSSELKTERISLRNTELALQSAQEKLKAEERAKRELESTLDTVSLHSQATTAEHHSIQREKWALETRVRELERIVQTHEAKGVSSNIPRKNGRPRSSSVSSFRLPALEQELNDMKAQLHTKDSNLRALEQKLAQTQNDLVKAENARISIDRAGEKRVSELLSVLERKEEELESLRGMDNAAEREEELLKRIDEDAAKIATLEKLVVEGQAARTSQARIQKLQSQLKVECEKAHRSDDLQNQLLREKEELVRQYEASQRSVEEGHQLLMARDRQIEELEAKHAHLLVELNTDGRPAEGAQFSVERPSPLFQRPNGFPEFPDESALADHIQTLLLAIDRLRGERDELKRALEFSQVEYRITTDGFQAHIASLTQQLKRSTECIAKDRPLVNASVERRMKRMASCAAAFAVVISNIQSHLDFSQDRLSATSADLASSNSQLHDVLAAIEGQKRSLDTNALDHDVSLRKRDVMAKELSDSNQERDSLRAQLVYLEGQVADAVENATTSELAREEAQQNLLSVEQRFAALEKNCRDIEFERNSLTLQITNLQDDISRVQDELADTQNRYNTLHAQQLAAMSTSDVIQALKDRIQELDARLVLRSNQIGDYQHDIRRLEDNVKLHEERLAEMTSELELLTSQKEAMVEDCAEARGARDEAIERSDASEEEMERLHQQLCSAKLAHETELSAKSSMISNLTFENRQKTACLTSIEARNAGLICELDSLARDHQRLTKELNAAVSCSRSLELENLESAEMQQTVVSLAVVYRTHKDTARRLQLAHEHITSLESQLGELKQKSTLVDIVERERREIETHHAEVEAELLKRIATMTTTQGRQTEDIAHLGRELENAKTQLQNSRESYADLEKLHDDVMQEFTAAKEVLELRLTETDVQIRCLDTDRRRSLVTLEAKFKRETDMLASNLEDREHEVEELRQQLQDVSEAHTLAEEKLHEELRSHETRHALMNDLEKDLRRIVADLRQRLTQTETETLALQEERQLLQAQITDIQADIQRSTSLTRYLESQVAESEHACMLLKENLQHAELTLAESEKAGKAAEFNLTLQTTQHEKVVAALRREVASLQSGPELRSALADLEEKNREMDGLLSAKCQEIEEYDDRILETLKANKKLTSKVESLTRKIQALQAKLSSVKNQSQECLPKVSPPKKASPISTPPVPAPAIIPLESYPSPSRMQENSASSLMRARTPELQLQSVAALPPSHTPGRTWELRGCEVSAGKKRPAPDDDERDSVPAEGHYSTDSCLRNGPTPRLRRAHGHPAGFTPVRGASLRKPNGLPSPGRRATSAMPSEVITDVTNSPRGPPGQGDGQLKKKRSWLGKARGGAGSQPASSRLGAFGGQR